MPIRFQVDPDFYDHPKTLGMSDAAVALWVRAGSYSAAKLTDGFVADAALAILSQSPTEAARELIRRGLWSRVRGGFRFHQWGDRNLSRVRVEADRESDRERKRRERAEARRNGSEQVNGHIVRADVRPDAGGIPGGVRGASVSVLVSESESGSGRGSSPTESAAKEQEPPIRCEKHTKAKDPPACGACADARREHNRWEIERTKRLASEPKCKVHRGQLAESCSGCRSEELSPA